MEEAAMELARRFEGQPLIRGLIQLLPGGSAIETTILATVARIEAERLRTFFDELSAGRVRLTPDVVESEDFLHAYFATTSAARRTRRRAKVRYLARLLAGSFGPGAAESIDEYEELLGIVEELSFRELTLLGLLAEAERATTLGAADNDLQRANKYWPQFEVLAKTTLDLEPGSLAPMLVRLQRSGCYAEITGAYWDYTGGRGHLTQLYRRLVRAAGEMSTREA